MRTTLLVCGAVLMLTLAGCSKSPEEGAVDTLNELGDVLEDVKTKDDAEKVRGKVRELVEEYTAYAKQFAEGEMDAEKARELAGKTKDAMGKIIKAMMNTEVAQVLQEELAKIR